MSFLPATITKSDSKTVVPHWSEGFIFQNLKIIKIQRIFLNIH
jgi:hypothetical protein